MKTDWLRDADHQHGIQMALAVLLAYGIPLALRLPEGFWAVMSALIVMRPNTGATLGAGWDRIRGTVVGTLAGLFGVWLRHAGLSLPAATLLIVTMLAFGGGILPTLRSAPITALIVVSSSGIEGHSALSVAGLRVLEIAIGIGAGLAVTGLAPSARAAPRFDAACAALLRQLAGQLRQALSTQPAASSDTAAPELRMALRRLALLATDVERESRLPWRRIDGPSDAAPARHRQRAALMGRIAQHLASLGRLFGALPATRQDPLWRSLGAATDEALLGLADAPADAAQDPLAPLRELCRTLRQRLHQSNDYDEAAALLAGPVRLLSDDLLLLRRLQSNAEVASRRST